MIKLYKLNDTVPRYWETWDNGDGSHSVHWGVLGETGEYTTTRSSLFKKATDKIQTEMDRHLTNGYSRIALEDHRALLIEYVVDGFGNNDDLSKRHKLEDRMNKTLGWAGLGACDGGSIGSNSMEVCCLVVDFLIAKYVVIKDLEGSEFANYTRIYDESIE